MSEGFKTQIYAPLRHSRGGLAFAILTLVPAILLAWTFDVRAQVGGRGADPIPAFVQDVGGGTEPTVNFDPSNSYLPSPPAGQTYQYTAMWDFGDASAAVVNGPGTSAVALAPVQHTYPDDVSMLYTVTLRIDVTVISQSNVSSAGPSASTTGQVHSAQVNFPPTLSLVNNSSPPTGQLPYQVNVNVAGSFDEDGFIIWGAIDWGDGSTDLISQLPPSDVALSSLHSYTAPGFYTITLSLIDNGRMDVGTVLDPTPQASDPAGALSTIQALQHTLIDNGVLVPVSTAVDYNDDKFLPILRQQTIQIQVPGNLLVVKGKFTLNFAAQNSDSFDAVFVLNTPVSSVANAKVQVFLGSGSNSLVLSQFTTDLKGNYFNSAQGLQFTVNPRKRFLEFKIKSASLQPAFQIPNSTVVNGYADVPVRIVIMGARAAPRRWRRNCGLFTTQKPADWESARIRARSWLGIEKENRTCIVTGAGFSRLFLCHWTEQLKRSEQCAENVTSDENPRRSQVKSAASLTPRTIRLSVGPLPGERGNKTTTHLLVH